MLNKILKQKQKEIETLTIETTVRKQKNVSFVNALKNPNHSLALIAEIKRASPSKGIINDAIDPVKVALAYEEAGADAISVLTDETFFKGSKEDLIAVKKHVNIPVLRKDFIIGKKQIDESKAIGADAILLIVKAIGVEKTYEFYRYAESLGLDCLVEIHEKEELTQLLERFTPKVIGVNNRNLANFQTTLKMTETIAQHIPKEAIFISESGIHSAEDIETVKKLGANGVLVGEALMKAPSPQIGIEKLFKHERMKTT